MSLAKKLSIGAFSISLIGLTGCLDDTSNTPKKPTDYSVYQPHDSNYTTSQSGVGVALGDVDGDGLNDLIVGSPSSVRYFRNLGDGKFKETQVICQPHDSNYTTSQSGVGVALGDVDGDIDLDLIVASPSRVEVYLNFNGKFVKKR
jgi:hypothetical protein